MIADQDAKRFAQLFAGRTDAYGTGQGRWVREKVSLYHYIEHLTGSGHGLGIAPLRDDGTLSFAAIDLDEPNFEAAREMADLLPGPTFIERSRSGNAHVFAFFSEPIEAWVPRGIMREATVAIGKPTVEVFPKQDRLQPGMLGNYINLPYFGNTRPVLSKIEGELSLSDFLLYAEDSLNDPDTWRKRARWLGIATPEERASNSKAEFGTQKNLHICAEHIIANRESNPVVEGHRAVVYFCLAKQLANCALYDEDEALQMMRLVNDASPDPTDDYEIRRILKNAYTRQFTSTGCDDPLFQPYAHPDCPIARGA